MRPARHFGYARQRHAEDRGARASSIAALDLAAKAVNATCNGAGRLELNAENTLTATVNGAGSITYTGDPIVKKSINGVGSISKRK